MEGAPKRRAARATGTTHLTHTMNYYMQWSLAEVLPLKEIKTKQTQHTIQLQPLQCLHALDLEQYRAARSHASNLPEPLKNSPLCVKIV